MRRSDVRPQAHVACYRLATGQLKWRKLVCAAETPGHGMMEEITHNLLSMHEGTIFYNTNLGAVAALRAEDGRTQWITAYPRARRITPERGAGQFYRDLNPCLAYRSWVFAAPSDTEHIFAFDAATGQIVWQTDPDEGTHGSHSVHLLGVAGESLIVSGDRLWWIDVHSGKVLAQFPDGGSSVPTEGAVEPRGCGRGILAGEHVYWPTREKVFVFSQRVSTPGQPEMVRQPIELNLDLADRQLPGGSLLMDQGIMLVVAAEELIALSETGEPPIEENPPPGEE
jgi:outer membrane protein assembly factor BamB